VATVWSESTSGVMSDVMNVRTSILKLEKSKNVEICSTER
jgi:hypothetical protein